MEFSPNEDQMAILKDIMESLDEQVDKTGRMYFVEGSAGTGKTWLLRHIKNEAQAKRLLVSIAASSAVAAALLGGVTGHSLFGLSRETPPNRSSVIENTDRAEHLQFTDLFIWDEISMNTVDHLIKADNLLRRLTRVDVPFGGKVVVFAGDMRGLLPPGRASECAFYWQHWPLVRKRSLTQNMRVNPTQSEYAAELLQIRALPNVQLDREMVLDDMDKLIAETFSGCSEDNTFNPVILTLTNDASLLLNDQILQVLLKETPVEYLYSLTESEFVTEPSIPFSSVSLPIDAEYQSKLENLTPSGCPPHKLALKIGACVMLLRNVDIGKGLPNGTILTVDEITADTLTCTIKQGPFAGTQADISRVNAYYEQGNRAFWRTQFPVCLAYARTIHKAQGQTFDKVGVILTDRVFADGQLYTALSRVKSKEDVLLWLNPNVYNLDDTSTKIPIDNKVDDIVFRRAMA